MKQGKTFEVSGEIYKLRFDINSLCELEDLLGRPVSQLGANMGIRELRTMFYCGLMPKHSLTDVGIMMSGLVEEQGMEKMQALITGALEDGLGSNSVAPEIKKKH